MGSRKPWRLSPLVAFIEDHTAIDATRHGVFNRLTGEALYLPEQLKEILLYLKDNPMPASDLDLLRHSPISQVAFARFEQGHFLVTSIEADALLRPFLDYRLLVPAMNPAITFRERGTQMKMIRLEESHVCRLPRTEAVPHLTEEMIPEAPANLLRCAGESWTVRESIKYSRGRMSTSEIWGAINWLCDPARQLIRAVPADADFRITKHPVHYLVQNLIPSEGFPNRSGEMIEAKSYYQEQVSDVDWNFDWVETTICHSFRYPTGAFGQQTYGERFCDSVLETFGPALQGLKQLDILEVGGGTGSFARAFLVQLQKFRERFGRINYSLMDCSRTMIDRQRRSLADVGITVRHVEQDAQEFSIPGEQFHIILANEMIADLKVAEAISDGHYARGGNPASPAWYHSGVFSFVDRLRDHLAPGGKAFLTEYEGHTEPSSPLAHLNHPEYPIHFGSIAGHAERVGLRPTLRSLSDFLNVSGEVEMLCGQQERYLCLNHLVSRHGGSIPYAAFCRESFEQKWGSALSDLGVGGIQFAPLDEGLHFGPELSQFQALILDKDS
jgi:hypothetical protein